MNIIDEINKLREYAYLMFVGISDLLQDLEKEKLSKQQCIDNINQKLKVLRFENTSHINVNEGDDNMANIKKKGSISVSRQKKTLSNGDVIYYERYMGRCYHNGKIKAVYGKTKAECEQKLHDLVKMLEENPQIKVSKKIKMKDWITYVFENYNKREIKESTYLVQSSRLNNILKLDKKFNETKLENVDEVICNEFLDKITSASNYSFAKQLISDSFKIAVARGLVPYDISVLMRGSFKEKNDNVTEIKKTKTILEYSTQHLLLQDAKKKKIDSIISLMLYSGMRLGEALGLKWENLTPTHIEVRQQFSRNARKITSLKTKSSARNIPLTIGAKNAIEAIYKSYNEETEYVFGDLEDMLSISNVISGFFQVKYSNLSAHSLRHTFASRLYAIGIDSKVIQSYLGHASVEMTNNVYIHATNQKELEEYKLQVLNDSNMKFI